MTRLIVEYEDEDLLIINKPAGVTVNRSETEKELTIQDLIEKKFDEEGVLLDQSELFAKRSGIAHRLDKETSGCLLVAKKAEVLEKLLVLFKERQIDKEYLALVHGKVEPKEGVMRLPIARSRFDRQQFGVSYQGKQAETAWRVERYLTTSEGEILSLLRLFPKTGRTHQIRVHMAHLRHPLFADGKYLNRKKLVVDRELLQRHFLHAARLAFTHPVSGEQLVVEARLPLDLEGVLSKLSSNV